MTATPAESHLKEILKIRNGTVGETELPQEQEPVTAFSSSLKISRVRQ